MEPVAALAFRAVGVVAPALVADVAHRVSRRVSVPCRVVADGGAIAAPDVAGRDQWDADLLLAALETQAAASAQMGTVLVGIAARDIGNPIFTHFFGRARLGGRALLVSTARLAPGFYGMADDAAVTAQRAALEVLHELGHVAGLRHCATAACLMRVTSTVEMIDLRGSEFCASCTALLPRRLVLPLLGA
jgi:archaemetzincin